MSRPMTLGVRALAFDDEGRVLLVRHTYVPGWHLPGGGVETGHTVTETLAKELHEEANVILAAPPRLVSVHLNDRVTRRDHVVVFRCDQVTQTAPKQRDLEIIEAEFFPVDGLPPEITRSSRNRIDESLGLAPPDPYW
ncbi:NUDIX domain-containing protein [Oricola cellulosilytica]|uniref:NUDIX domain-containing protein n=2 Tax=Oricola cellulosilytica TaxID=1429082 RepID=A0A4R0PDE7_9HYPH|nr:NUDIX domain-containing protein [Oricola cellulosilytica]